MTRLSRLPVLFAFLITSLLLLAPAAASAGDGTVDDPVRIGFNGGDSPGIIRIKANAFTAFLEERSGILCEPVITESYSQLIRSIAENKVDFAWLSPLGYITAAQVADTRVLLKAVRNEQPFYWSVILVRKDSGLKNLGDLKNRSFAFTHLGSTSGYVVPMSSLLDEGVDPDRFFSEIVYAGGHSAVIRMILDGKVDAGATFADDPTGKEGSWTAEEFIAAAEAKLLRPIFFSPPIPGDTFTVTARCGKDQPKLVALLKTTLLEMGDTRTGHRILSDLYNIDDLTEGSDADYDPIRQAFQSVRNR
jgi:phosphonate transport system substrate-binding protein